MSEKVEFKVDVPRLFDEIASNPSTQTTRIGLQVILRNLGAIAQHAIDTNDLFIIERLQVLSIIEPKQLTQPPAPQRKGKRKATETT